MVGGGYYEMTKKFWNDWQKRIGETKEINGFYNGGIGGSLVGYLPFRILSAKFNKDVVDLILEEASYNPISGRHHVENRYVTLNRKYIATVRFRN
jgi:hypothetical protein